MITEFLSPTIFSSGKHTRSAKVQNYFSTTLNLSLFFRMVTVNQSFFIRNQNHFCSKFQHLEHNYYLPSSVASRSCSLNYFTSDWFITKFHNISFLYTPCPNLYAHFSFKSTTKEWRISIFSNNLTLAYLFTLNKMTYSHTNIYNLF